MTDEQIDTIARKFAELIEADDASPSGNVPTPMARIGGAIREALNENTPPAGHILDERGVVKRLSGTLPETKDGVVWTDRSKPVYTWGSAKPYYLDQDWNVPIAFFNPDTREWQDMHISECYSAPDAPLNAARAAGGGE